MREITDSIFIIAKFGTSHDLANSNLSGTNSGSAPSKLGAIEQ
jgi:hypothetical protein